MIQGILGSQSEIPLVDLDLENDQIQGRYLCGLVEYLPKGAGILISNDLPHVLPLQITEYRTTEHAMTDTNDVPSVAVVSEHSDSLETTLLFNVE